MSSADLKGDAIAVFTEYRNPILGLAGAAVVFLLLSALFGGRVLGGVMFVGYSLLWLAVVAFVLWLFYRLVVAAERIASAQERLASAETFPGPAPPAGETDDGGAETGSADDESETDG